MKTVNVAWKSTLMLLCSQYTLSTANFWLLALCFVLIVLPFLEYNYHNCINGNI